MKSFGLGLFNEKPPIDELPVGKIINFEKSDDVNKNILSHGRIFYVPGQGLYIRQWIFQSDFNNDDFNIGFLIKTSKKNKESDIVVFCDRKNLIMKRPFDEQFKENLIIKRFKGEDLEGWFWGFEILIKESDYLKYISDSLPEVGGSIKGNLFSNGYLKSKLFKEDIGKFKFVNW